MSKIVYKVVSIRNGRKMSAVINTDIAVEYKVGEEVRAKIGELLAFSSLSHAKKWLDMANYYFPIHEIWEAEAKKTWKPRFAFGSSGCISLEDAKRNWKNWLKNPIYNGSIGDVVFCSSIKLLTEVKNEN